MIKIIVECDRWEEREQAEEIRQAVALVVGYRFGTALPVVVDVPL